MNRERGQRVVIAIAVLVAIQLAGLAIYRAVQRKRRPDVSPGFRVERLSGEKRAPDILLERLDGQLVSVHAIGGDVRLVHFWATWCPPCIEELPGLLASSRELAGRGLTLIAVSVDRDWEPIRAFFGGSVPPEIYRAVDRDAHEVYDVFSLPDTYLVPSDGHLLLRYGGARAWRSEAARQHLREQLP